jgi:ribulose-5-phosphate 4-epimerase/fuculose-1-phosphate aldolase
MAGFIGEEAPVFEIRGAGGPATDLLISNANVGKAPVRCCGGHNIVVMRGHGSTVIADSLRLAVFRAAYAELNARYQCEAASLSETVYLSKEEGEAAVRSVEKAIGASVESLERKGRAHVAQITPPPTMNNGTARVCRVGTSMNALRNGALG